MVEIIIAVLLIFWIVTISIFRAIEKREYNNGHCKCGGAWKYFDTDSQGGDGYYCKNCGKVIWINWIRVNRIDEGDGHHG